MLEINSFSIDQELPDNIMGRIFFKVGITPKCLSRPQGKMLNKTLKSPISWGKVLTPRKIDGDER